MCELLGMSSSRKTVINVSLSVLAERGENPNYHGDGWGIAFHDEDDVRLIKDTGPAKNSEWVKFIQGQEIKCHDVIAHIRKSTIGVVKYSNTHPFTRELLGTVHSFAHNGTMTDVLTDSLFKTNHYNAIGDTDSEHSFCYLMDRMYDLWRKYPGTPPIEERFQLIDEFASQMRKLGPCNFLYSDGETLFAHGHERHDPATKKVSWPGLHFLNHPCSAEDEGIHIKGDPQHVVLFASVPLNKENWIPLEKGEIIAVNKGKIWGSKSANPYRQTQMYVGD